jgi:hypothetical protein
MAASRRKGTPWNSLIFCPPLAVYFLTLKRTSGGVASDFLQRLAQRQRARGGVVLWILVPLVLFIIFGHYVHKKAERLRAEEARPRVLVSIKLAGEGMAVREELQLRNAVEDEIVKRGIGTVDDAGSGGGVMHLQVIVADVERAEGEIREVLAAMGVLERATISGLSPAH